jgi:predicted dehydrogenase
MANSNPIRVGIIGCGFFAPNHVNSWVQMPGVEIAALCDLNEERARQLADRTGLKAPVFADVTRMIDQTKPDFIDIITSPETHPDLVAFAAEHRIPAIVQKPMSLDFAASRKMVESMDEANLPFMVHENFRFQSPIREVGKIVRSGEIGKPTYAMISFRTGYDIYAGQPYLAKVKRFVLLDLGVHVLDVARYLLGEAERVHCEVQSVKPGIAGEDMASMLVRHINGAMSVVECSYASPLADEPFPETMISVEGTDGAVTLSAGYNIAVRSGTKVRRLNADAKVLPWASKPWHVVQDSVLRTQEHWLDCFRRGVESEISGRDNLATLALVEASYESVAKKTAVRPVLTATRNG